MNRFILSLIAKNPNDRFDSALQTLENLNLLEQNLGRTESFISSLASPEDSANKEKRESSAEKSIVERKRISLSLISLICLVCFFGCVLSVSFTQSEYAAAIKDEISAKVLDWLQGLMYIASKP